MEQDSLLTDTGPPDKQGKKPSSRLEERVYEQLLDSIRSGRYSLGQRLPSENDLAVECQVSRPVIRTALARLREDGLIVSRQGAGSFVSSGTAPDGAGFGPLGSIDDIGSFFRFRRLIEAEAAAAAARRAKPEDVAHLTEMVEEMESMARGGTATMETDVQFHLKIAELSDNRFIVETLQMLRPQWVFVGKFVRSLGRTGYAKGKRDMCAEHREIVAALAAGDPDAAGTAMDGHILGSEKRVFKGE